MWGAQDTHSSLLSESVGNSTADDKLTPNFLQLNQIMRKIETQMNAAIQANQDWKSGNTQVITIEGVSFIYLHGNQIASVDEDSMTIYDGGWQSTTTKSRLNALCDEFCIAGEGVFQKNYKWFVRKFTGQLGDKKVFTTEEFTNGYIFAWLKLRKSGQRPTLTSIQSF